jgi:hypothetical protein
MTREEAFEQTKQAIIGDNILITSVDDAEALHKRFIELRTQLAVYMQLVEIMPHYRGEQVYGWDIRPGIFRPPLTIADAKAGKDFERKAVSEFEKVIVDKVGKKIFRDLFNNEKHGKDWDLLFQAQHAGVKTTLTDWSPEIISALFFATEESNNHDIEKSDGQLWNFIIPVQNIYGHNTFPTRDTFYNLDPFDLKETVLINPSSYLDNIQDRIFEYRMYRQKGRFVMPSAASCHIPLNQQTELQKFLIKARIPSEFKQKIREELAERKVIRANMYIDENPNRQDFITEVNRKVFGI